MEKDIILSYDLISKDDSFHNWHKYQPHDVQYLRYAEKGPSLIAAGFKVGDVYSAFTYAHAALMFSLEKNYGVLAADEKSIEFIQYMFVRDAILNYSICEDLSWQVVWAYIQPADIRYLMKDGYSKLAKDCNRENLLKQLDCAISQHHTKADTIKSIVQDFDDDPDVKDFRKLYNFIKHRGDIHVEDLGNQDESLLFNVNGQNIKMLIRDSYSMESLRDDAWNYNCKFENYFNKLLKVIFPEDYLNNKINLSEGVIGALQMMDAQNENVNNT